MVNIFRNNTNNNHTNAEQSTLEDKEVKKEKRLILIKGKVAEKGTKSFLRCGVKFTDEFQETEVDEPTLKRLKAEPKLKIDVIKK